MRFQKITGKRKNTEQSTQVEKVAKLDCGGSRRSSRHRRVRGEKEIEVSSTQKLLDLKIEVIKHLQWFSLQRIDVRNNS